jgi:hypothetical protein
MTPAGFNRFRLVNPETGSMIAIGFSVPYLTEVNILLQFETCQGELVAIIQLNSLKTSSKV